MQTTIKKTLIVLAILFAALFTGCVQETTPKEPAPSSPSVTTDALSDISSDLEALEAGTAIEEDLQALEEGSTSDLGIEEDLQALETS